MIFNSPAGQTSRLTGWQRRFGHTRVLGAYVLFAALISFGTLAVFAALIQQPLVFPSLGATAFVFYFSSNSVQAAPRNVFCGQLIGVVAGVFALFGDGLAPRAACSSRRHHFDRGRWLNNSAKPIGHSASRGLGHDRAGHIDQSGPRGAFPALGPARGRLSLISGFGKKGRRLIQWRNLP